MPGRDERTGHPKDGSPVFLFGDMWVGTLYKDRLGEEYRSNMTKTKGGFSIQMHTHVATDHSMKSCPCSHQLLLAGPCRCFSDCRRKEAKDHGDGSEHREEAEDHGDGSEHREEGAATAREADDVLFHAVSV